MVVGKAEEEREEGRWGEIIRRKVDGLYMESEYDRRGREHVQQGTESESRITTSE